MKEFKVFYETEGFSRFIILKEKTTEDCIRLVNKIVGSENLLGITVKDHYGEAEKEFDNLLDEKIHKFKLWLEFVGFYEFETDYFQMFTPEYEYCLKLDLENVKIVQLERIDLIDGEPVEGTLKTTSWLIGFALKNELNIEVPEKYL